MRSDLLVAPCWWPAPPRRCRHAAPIDAAACRAALRLTRPLQSCSTSGRKQFASHPAMSRSTTRRRPLSFYPYGGEAFML